MFATLLVAIGISTGNLGFISLNEDHCSDIPECLSSRIFVHRDEKHLEDLWQDLGVGIDTEIRVQVNDSLSRPLVASNWTDLRSNLHLLPRQAWIGKTQLNCKNWQTNGDYPEQCFVGTVSQGLPQSCNKLRTVYCACRVFGITQPPTLSPSWSTPTTSPSMSPSRAPATTAPTTSPSTSRPSRSPSATPTLASPSLSPSSSQPSVTPSRSPQTSRPSQSPVTSQPSRSPTTPTSHAPSTSPTFTSLWVSAEKIEAALVELVIPEIEIWMNDNITGPVSNSLLTPTAFQSTTQTPTPSYNAAKALDGVKTQNSISTSAGISRTTDGLTDYWRTQIPGGPRDLDSIFRVRFWGTNLNYDLYSSFVSIRVRRFAVTDPYAQTDFIWSATFDRDITVGAPQDFYPSSSGTNEFPQNVMITATYSPSSTNVAVREMNFFHKKQPQVSLKEHTLANDEFPTNSPSLPATNAFDKSLSTFSLTNGAFSYHYLRSFVGYLNYVDLDRIEICDASEAGYSLVNREILIVRTTFFPEPTPPFVIGDSRVSWRFTIQVDSTAAAYCHSYRPTDVESGRWLMQQKLQGETPGDKFGGAIDVTDDETMAIVQSSVQGSGWLRLFTRSGVTWTPYLPAFTPTGLSVDAYVGSSLSIWDSVIVAGAPGHDSERGAVVIYRIINGIPVQSQLITGDETLSFFPAMGTSVSLHSGLLAVGCPGDNIGQGVILMYRDNGTQFVREGAPIRITGLAGQPQVGTTVSVWDEMVAFSSGDSVGYAWVFRKNASLEYEQMGSRLQASATISGLKYFGASLSLHKTRLVVGCSRENANVGSVYVFTLIGGSWIESQRLVGSNPVANQFQGTRVSLRDDYIAVGAPSLGIGSIYIYRYLNNTFREIRHLEATDYTGSDTQQGISVSIRNLTVLFGSQRDESLRGAVWSITRDNYASQRPTNYPTSSPSVSSPSRAPSTSNPSRAPSTSNPSRAPSVAPTPPTTRTPTTSPSVGSLFVSVEANTTTNQEVIFAEMQIFMNNNPNTALASPTLTPTAVQSSTYSFTNSPSTPTVAANGVDGVTGGVYVGGQIVHTLATGTQYEWWRVQVPGSGYQVSDIFRLGFWGRTDGCCTTQAITFQNRIRVRYNAVTNPASTASVLWDKQVFNNAPGFPMYYYPNPDQQTPDVYLSLERTFSPTTTTIQINEIRVFMKSQPNINVILGYNVVGQESEFPGYPSTNAVDGNLATFSHTSQSGPGNKYWIIYLGSLYYGDIDRIEFVNRDCCESMVGATLKLRTSTVIGYAPTVTDNSNVIWSYQIGVVSGVTSFGHSYRPIDVEFDRWTSQQKLVSGLAANHQFGTSVALNQNGTVLVVGAPSFSSSQGAIYVYRRIGLFWVLEAGPLQGTGVSGAASQGSSVDIWDSIIVVGAPNFNSNDGCTIVYEYDGVSSWYQKQLIVGTSTGTTRSQGRSVAISGSTIVIGVPGYTSTGVLGGFFIFQLSGSTFTQVGSIRTPTGQSGSSSIGTAVSIWGTSIVVSGPADGVWVYTLTGPSTWTQQGGKLSPSNTYVTQNFGSSLSIQGDTLLIGDGLDNNNVGCGYVFTRSSGTWTQSAKLVGSNPEASQFQGLSVSLWNDYAVIGARGASLANNGSIYIYRNTPTLGWREVRHVTGTGSITAANQGSGVSLRNLSVAVGAFRDNSSRGAVWIIHRDSTPPPTGAPTQNPTTTMPSRAPSFSPTASPSTSKPSISPSTSKPSISPSTSKPSISPSTSAPSRAPTTSTPSGTPTRNPTTPTTQVPTTSPSSASMFVSLERPSLSSGYINMAEVQIFMNSDPATALSPPTLMPTAAQSSSYSGGVGLATPATPAPVAVDGNTAGMYNAGPTTSQLAFTNAVVERSWWRVRIPGSNYKLDDVFRIALWHRSDVCCDMEMVSPSQGVSVRIRSSAVTDPSNTAGLLWTKQFYINQPGFPMYYYPHSQSAAQDLYLSLERPTFSPTQATIQVNELSVYMKSNPSYRINLGYNVLAQESTLSPSFPATHAVDGNVATFSHTNGGGGLPWWIQYLGSLYYGDIDRIEFVNRDYYESMVDARLRLRANSVNGYLPNPTDTSDVVWEFTIRVISTTTSFAHTYRPTDVENFRWTSQQKYIGTGATSGTRFGYSVSINQNETVMVVGGPMHNSNQGAIWIYHRVGVSWVLHTGPRQATEVSGSAYQGTSVDIFESTIVVGAYGCSSNAGCTIVYEFDGVSIWYQKQLLVGTGASDPARQGNSVSIHGDTIAIGGYTDASSVGATWIFVRNASGLYTQQGNKLVGTGNTGSSLQGFSVSLWGDSVAIGAPGDNSNMGAVWVFTRSAGTWSQQGSKITASGSIGSSIAFGVSISHQRDTLVVGASTEHSTGAVYILTRSGSTWTQRQRLVGSNPLASQAQGSSVYIWDNYVAMGAVESGGVGSVYIFRQETSTTWREVRHVTGTVNIGNSAQGRSICLRNLSLAFGGDLDNSNTGAVWTIFRDPMVSPTSTPTQSPSRSPSKAPSLSSPSKSPITSSPSLSPIKAPSNSPTTPTTRAPSSSPSLANLWVSLETTTVANNPIEVAELQLFTVSNPNTAISSPTLTPTVAQSSNFSPTQFFAIKAVDGVTAGVAASDQVSITGAVSERAWLRVQVPGTGLIGVDHLFKIVIWPRTDVCCQTNLRDRSVRLRMRSSAVTDPSSSTGLLLDKQIQVQSGTQPINYYPSSNFAVQDLYLTVERTASPTPATIELMEMELYLKSQPTVNIISGFTVFCAQDSEFPGFPCTNALDGSYSTFTSTANSTTQHFWNVYIGSLAWQDIGRISLYFRSGGNSITGCFVRLRASTSAIPYTSITVSDTTNVVYSFTLGTVSSVDTVPFNFIPYGIEELRWTRQIKLLGTAATGTRVFGNAVAINHNESVAIVGGRSTSSFQGRLWIYHRNESSNQWYQIGPEFRSSSFSGSAGQQGYSVAVYESTLVWGAYTDSSGAGRVYIWQYDGVSGYYQVANFRPTGICTTTACASGTSVAIWGNYAVSGARLDVGGEGSLLIYKKTGSTWAFQVRLTQSDGLTGNLGRTVAMYQDTIVSGGPQRNTLRGAAWVFVRDPGTDTWSQQGGVLIPTGLVETSSQLRCGTAVAIFDNWLAIGCTNHLNNAGAVVMYNRTGNTWTQRQIINPSSPLTSFGVCVDIWNDYMVVGSTSTTGGGVGYIYKLVSATWLEVKRITPTSPVSSSQFGSSCSIRNKTVLIGGPGDNSNVGATWVVYRDP